MNERSPYIAWLIAGVAVCLIWIGSNEYRKISSRILETNEQVQELTAETKLTLQTIRETIEDLRKKLFRLETEYGKLEAQLSQPVAAKPKRIIAHCSESCGPCNTWKSTHLPQWKANGWTVEIVNETVSDRSWPWFEIFDESRPRRVIEGVLPLGTYQELVK